MQDSELGTATSDTFSFNLGRILAQGVQPPRQPQDVHSLNRTGGGGSTSAEETGGTGAGAAAAGEEEEMTVGEVLDELLRTAIMSRTYLKTDLVEEEVLQMPAAAFFGYAGPGARPRSPAGS
jgi:hypothetical protein